MRVTVLKADSLTPALARLVTEAKLAVLLRACGDRLEVPRRASLTVRCTDDAELRELNLRYAQEDHATDVLSFAGDGTDNVGDIAISVERAAAQAPGDDVAREIRLLAVHGLLHCRGHDHAQAEDAKRMTELTRDLLGDPTIPDLQT